MSRLATGEAGSGSGDAVETSTEGSANEVVSGIEGRPSDPTVEIAGRVEIGGVAGCASVGLGRKAGFMMGGRSLGLFKRLKMAAFSAPMSISDIFED